MKYPTIALLLLSAAAAPARGQSELYAWNGNHTEDRFGHSVAGIGDLNGDGFSEVLVGVPGDFPGGDAYRGSARVYSGLDGTELFPGALEGIFPLDFYGFDVAGVGDANGDGTPDFAVSNLTSIPSLGNRVTVYSGLDASFISETHGLPQDEFGFSIDGVGDANGDGFDDVLVGEPGWDNRRGRARVFSGLDGSLIHLLTGEFEGDDFGYAVSGGGDANGNGTPDFIVGATHDHWAFGGGYAKVYDGQSKSLIGLAWGDHAGDRLGAAVNLERDVDNDGHADYIVGIPGFDPSGVTDAGMVMVYSGIDGSTIRFHGGDVWGTFFGESVDTADTNADGWAEVLVGAPQDDSNGINAGRVAVFSGRYGHLLFEELGNTDFDGFGTGLDGAGTMKACTGVGNDAYEEIVVGAPRLDQFSPNGYARVYTNCGLFVMMEPSVKASKTILVELLEGGPSDLGALFVTAVNKVPILLQLGPVSAFDKQGKIEISIPTSPAHEGIEIELVALGLVNGKLVWSEAKDLKVEKGEK